MIIKKKKKMSIAEVNYKLQKLFMKKALIVLCSKASSMSVMCCDIMTEYVFLCLLQNKP